MNFSTLLLFIFTLSKVARSKNVRYWRTGYGQGCSGKWNQIVSAKECKNAAANLSLDWGGEINNASEKSVKGCFHRKAHKVFFNNNTEFKQPYLLNYAQLCYTGTYIRTEYGKLCSGNRSHITTEQDCERAAAELGLNWGGTNKSSFLLHSPCFHSKHTTNLGIKTNQVFFSKNAKYRDKPLNKDYASICHVDITECPAGFSLKIRSTGTVGMEGDQHSKTLTKQQCGEECNLSKESGILDCRSFEFVNLLDRNGIVKKNCHLHRVRFPQSPKDISHSGNWIFCSQIDPVAESSSTFGGNNRSFGPHLAVDGLTGTFTKTDLEKSPWFKLTLSQSQIIHRIILNMTAKEGNPSLAKDVEKAQPWKVGQVILMHNTTKLEEPGTQACATFTKSDISEDGIINIICKSLNPANSILVQVTGETKHHLIINEVNYYSTPFKSKIDKAEKKKDRENKLRKAIVGPSLVILFLIMLGTVGLLSYKNKEKKKRLKQLTREKDIDQLHPNIPWQRQIEMLPYDLKKYEIEKSKFKIGQTIGEGQFGMVSFGTITDLYGPETGEIQVAVKQVKNTIDETQIDTIIGELKIMSNLECHPNLVNLIAACTSDIASKQIYLLLEYCSDGDLKKALANSRDKIIAKMKNPDDDSIEAKYNSGHLINWCYHIAKGMEYLESKLIMHGDLAARNILLNDECVAKITDFGLSKQMLYKQNYKKVNRRMIPWAWMALEYLQTGEFHLQSDVWSYGVLVWEIYSLGNKPYGIEQYEDVTTKLIEGERLPIPEYMEKLDKTNEIYKNVMKPCWDEMPTKRPKFGDITKILETIMGTGEVEKYNQMVDTFNDSQKNLYNARNSEQVSYTTEANDLITNNATSGGYNTFSTNGQGGYVLINGNAENVTFYSSNTDIKEKVSPAKTIVADN